MSVCRQCGARFPVDAGFCPHDGSPLAADGTSGSDGDAAGTAFTEDPPHNDDPSEPQLADSAVPDFDSIDEEARRVTVPTLDERPLPVLTEGLGAGDDVVGQVFDGRYRIDALVGEGGMGTVYRATHLVIEKTVALKLLRDQHAKRAEVAARFTQEARLASRIKHSNVVDVLDYGIGPRGAPYYVMELLTGETLGDRIDREGRLDPRHAVQLALQIANGLCEAHRQGVVHRDLKPPNVFICRAQEAGELVKIIDFGIARVPENPGRLTAEGAVLGTPEYMSPEQARGDDVDVRSDLYSLGIILFEMLVGRPPFVDASAAVVLQKQIEQPVPALATAEPALPPLPRTEWVLRRLLTKSRRDRPSTASTVVGDLHDALSGDFHVESASGTSESRRTVAIGSGAVGEWTASQESSLVAPAPALRSPVFASDWPPVAAAWSSKPVGLAGEPSATRSDSPSSLLASDLHHDQLRPARPLRRVLGVAGAAAVVAALCTVVAVKWSRSRPGSPSTTVDLANGPSGEPSSLREQTRGDREAAFPREFAPKSSSSVAIPLQATAASGVGDAEVDPLPVTADDERVQPANGIELTAPTGGESRTHESRPATHERTTRKSDSPEPAPKRDAGIRQPTSGKRPASPKPSKHQKTGDADRKAVDAPRPTHDKGAKPQSATPHELPPAPVFELKDPFGGK